MGPEVRLILALTIWISLCLLFAENLEVLFVLILLGVLVLRVLTDMFTSRPLKDRMNFFIYTFLFIFTVIFVRKVYLILSST